MLRILGAASMTGYGGEGGTEVEDYFLSSGFIYLIKLRHMGGRVISRGRIGVHLWT